MHNYQEMKRPDWSPQTALNYGDWSGITTGVPSISAPGAHLGDDAEACAMARHQTLALVDGIPPVAARPGRPRRRPEALLGDKGYNSNSNREELRKRRILPVISRKRPPTSRAWASSATSWSRPSLCSTSSEVSPPAGNAAPNSTTPSSHWPAASSAGGG